MSVDLFESLIPELELINEEGHMLWLEVTSRDAKMLKYSTYCERMCTKVAGRMDS